MSTQTNDWSAGLTPQPTVQQTVQQTAPPAEVSHSSGSQSSDWSAGLTPAANSNDWSTGLSPENKTTLPTEGASSEATAVNNPDESTIGKVWDWTTKPLLDLHREGAGPIESGVENFASGLTSPLSLGLMIISGGTSALAEGAGAEAISALSPELAAGVSKAAPVISKLMSAGFTGQQIYSVAQAVPAVSDAIKSGDYDTAERLGTEAILGGVAAVIGAKHAVGELYGKSEFSFPGSKEAIGEHQAAVEKANLQSRNFRNANAELIKNKPLDMAAQLYHEAGGDIGVLEQQRQDVMASPNVPDALKKKYADIFQKAESLPDNIKMLSDKLRQDYANDFARGQNLRMFDPEGTPVANYAGQHQYNPDDATQSSLAPTGKPTTPSGTKSPNFTQQRTFPTITDALKAGYQPVDEGLAAARVRYIQEFGNAEGLRNAESTLQNRFATDGAPIGVNPASVRTISADVNGKTASVKAIPVPDGANLAALQAGGRLVEANGKSYVNVSDYQPGPNKFNLFRMRGGEPTFNENLERVPIFDRANLLINPEYAKGVQQAFQDASWIRQSPILKGVLKASTMGKKSLLSLSPFHWLTEGERGLQMGLNPAEVFNPPEIDPEGRAMTTGTKYGLTLLGDKYRNLMEEGVYSDASWTHKIPIFGRLIQQSEDKLFSDYIPRLKAASFEKVTAQLEKQNPDWSEAQVMTKASEVVNGAFGGVNWRQLGVAMSSQDAMRLMFLAPDFTGSQLLFAKAGLGAGGSVVWQSMARMLIYNVMAAQAVNLLLNHKIDMSHPLSVDSPDGKSVYNVRTMPTDIFHALTDPRQFIEYRLNPTITRPAIEFLTGKDESGRNASYGQQISDFIKNVTPISAQGFFFKRPDQTVLTQIGHGVGVNKSMNRTQAEQMAIEKASARSSQGAIPQGELAQHQFANNLVDQLRSGQIDRTTVNQAVQAGQISPAQGARIKKEATYSPVAGRVENLPLSDALDVYQVASPQERNDLMPVIQKKILAFHKDAHKNETAQQILFMQHKIYSVLNSPAGTPSGAPNALNPNASETIWTDPATNESVRWNGNAWINIQTGSVVTQ